MRRVIQSQYNEHSRKHLLLTGSITGYLVLKAVPGLALDISPLCLCHNQPMILWQKTLHPISFFGETYHWFACSVYGFNLRYDM
jgi:hypothetical protein